MKTTRLPGLQMVSLLSRKMPGQRVSPEQPYQVKLSGITRVRIARRILPISITDSLTIRLQPAIFTDRSSDCVRKVETALVLLIVATC